MKKYKKYKLTHAQPKILAREPEAPYRSRVTIEDVRKAQLETERMSQETERMSQETKRMFQETDKKLREQMQETDRKLNKLAELYGNVSKNNADVAESFFYNGLSKKMQLGELKFDYIDRNVTRKRDRVENEYDIILFNKKKVIVVEVKYKLHINDVERMVQTLLPNFRVLYKEYSECELYGCVAAFDLPAEARNLAQQYGLFILHPDGKNAELANTKHFVPARF